jgi:DNA topoisomerase-2
MNENFICVYNNGDGVSVKIHKEEGVHIPKMIFGHLFSNNN